MATQNSAAVVTAKPGENQVKQAVNQEQIEYLEVRSEHLNYLRKGVYTLKQKDDQENYLLMLERLIYLILDYLPKNSPKQLNFDPYEETIIYVEKMSKKAVETFKEGKYQEAAKVVSHVIDLLSQEDIHLLYQNRLKLLESKILAYNNLSCVYNALKKYDLSATVISSAIDIEEELVAESYGHSEMSVISTYFNYSAILSQAKQFDKTLGALERGFAYIKKAEAKKDLSDSDKFDLKNLSISGFMMMGKEYKRSDNVEKARGSFEKALVIAKELKKQEVVNSIETALAQLKK